MPKILEIHALQTLGPNNINRDDTGAPKTAPFGGVTRSRVSSQCWKHAIRNTMKETLGSIKLSTRTQQVGSHLVQLLTERGVQNPEEIAEMLVKESGIVKERQKNNSRGSKKQETTEEESTTNFMATDALLLMGNKVYEALADKGVEASNSEDLKAWIKDNSAELKSIPLNDKAVDIALFGRMNTSNPALDIDAACQFAHAIGVSKAELDADFYTAVDEIKVDSNGAGMMGDIEFASSTLYRYASVNVTEFAKRLEDTDATVEALNAFVKAFITTVPTGKINSFANSTLPELVIVTLREDQPINLVGAFEQPVTGNIPLNAAIALAKQERNFENIYGLKPTHTWTVGFPELAEQVAPVFGPAVSLSEMQQKLSTILKEQPTA